MYFHCPVKAVRYDQEASEHIKAWKASESGSDSHTPQLTFSAVSYDGVNFTLDSEQALAPFYLRVFHVDGVTFGVAKLVNEGVAMYVRRAGAPTFTQLPGVMQDVRHTAVLVRHNAVYMFYSRMNDSPEHIRWAELDMPRSEPFHRSWIPSTSASLAWPNEAYEGGGLSAVAAGAGSVKGLVRGLRDPAVLELGGGARAEAALFYAVGGESGIGGALLTSKCAST